MKPHRWYIYQCLSNDCVEVRQSKFKGILTEPAKYFMWECIHFAWMSRSCLCTESVRIDSIFFVEIRPNGAVLLLETQCAVPRFPARNAAP